ncbi:hypothetical protein BaRGS_00018648 [Batillaria attramentaria]|uniref:Uncharacterized protein n=1 Tax=Batillaria attramentaria TaxID=370345 RepID=A0ABD0KST2_9CAEN
MNNVKHFHTCSNIHFELKVVFTGGSVEVESIHLILEGVGELNAVFITAGRVHGDFQGVGGGQPPFQLQRSVEKIRQGKMLALPKLQIDSRVTRRWRQSGRVGGGGGVYTEVLLANPHLPSPHTPPTLLPACIPTTTSQPLLQNRLAFKPFLRLLF